MKHKCLAFFIFCTLNLFAQEQEIEVFNTTINSSYAEFGVSFINQTTVLFASSKKNENDKTFSKNRRQTNRHLYLELYKGMVTSRGDIIETGKFSSDVDNKFFESDIAFSPDRKTIYFTWNNFYNTEKRKDSAKWKSLQLMKATINEQFEISNIAHLPFNNEKYSVRYPAVSKDGKKLFFASNMPDGFGENDIYEVDILENESYSKPKNLGPNVNSEQDEIFPFIDDNNTLYFTSIGFPGLGGFDIFKSENMNGVFQPAENLPSPINSEYDDINFVINNANNSGFFTSNRTDSKGDVDIYAFKIRDKSCIQTIAGIVQSEFDNNPLTNVKVSLFENDQLKEVQMTDLDAKYTFEVSCESSYKIIAEKDGFISVEKVLTTSTILDVAHTKNLTLKPVECIQTIVGIVKNELDNSLLTNVKVSLFENNQLKEIQITDLDAKYTFEVNCDASYKIIAEKDGFISVENVLITSTILDVAHTKNLTLKPVECIQTIVGIVQSEFDNNPLSNVKVSLFENNQLKEVKITDLAAKYTFEVNCESSYKIIAEKDGFISMEDVLTTSNVLDVAHTKNLILKPVKCIQTIVGIVQSEFDNSPLTNVKVSLFENNQLKELQITDLDAKYTFEVNCDASYKIIAEKDGFISIENVLTTSTILDVTHTKNLTLKPVECIQTIAGIVQREFDNNPLTNVKVSLFENNQLKEVQMTDLDAKYTFEVNCDASYKIIAEKDGFISMEDVLTTTNILDFAHTKNLILKPVECIQTIVGIVQNEFDNSPLSIVKVSLFENNQLKEVQITDLNAKYTFEVSCESSYKIIAEKDGFISVENVLTTSTILDVAHTKNLILKPVECIQTISGIVQNKFDKNLLSNVKVSLFENNQLKEVQITDLDAKYTFEVNCESSYKIIAEKDGFISMEDVLTTTNILDVAHTKNLTLKPVKCIQTIAGIVQNEFDNNPLSNVKVSLFENNQLKEVQITDLDAKYTFEVNCDASYKIIAEKDGFISLEDVITTSNILDVTHTKNLILKPVECIQTITGIVQSEFDNSPLSNVKVSLFENDQLKEVQITDLDAKYTFEVSCESSYKIIAEKDGYVSVEEVLTTSTILDVAHTKNLILKPVKCIQTIAGIVKNELDNNPLSNVKVSLFENNQLKELQITDLDAKFTFEVNCESSYKIIAEKDGFVSVENVLTTSNIMDFANNKNLILKPLECHAQITVTIFDNQTKKQIQGAQIQILKNNTLTNSLRLNEQSSFKEEVDCKTEYKLVTSKNGYKNDITFIKTSTINNEEIVKEISLEPIEEFITQNKEKLIKTDIIYFDLDSDEIRPDAAIEINKVIGVLIKYPTIKIEVGSHTDSRAPDNYNLILSENRANSTISYMVANGIDPDRLIGKGYGETKLVNKCSNGVECTNAEHELNRRTEFKIIEE